MLRWILIILGLVTGIAVIVRLWVHLNLAGVTVTSWWRDPWHNARIGGVWNSRHLIGWAVDIVPVTAKNISVLKKFFKDVVNEGDHIHAELV
jgi:hypothetical protein